uniref:Protein MAIN-LIKE 1-like n=1 Tax=Cicer arietinum TaxID=3827 RepID=A0A1S3DYL3_CICAR|nr:protein MAIN-LIKE 1-like [Cicer arietinum]
MSLHMVRTMFIDRDDCVILNKGTSNADGHRVRPTAFAREQQRRDGGYPGGPVDSSVLRTFGDHVATLLWDDMDRGELRVFSNEKKSKEVVIEHEEVEKLVKSSGLYSLLKCSYEMIDKWIISASVERWHRDTNSFHLPIGEKKITLDDVSSLLNILITGAFFSVSVFNKDEGANILVELLGVSHDVAYAEFNVTRTTTISDKRVYAVSVAYLECFRDLNSCGDMHGVQLLLLTYMIIFEKPAYIKPELFQDYPRALKWKPKRDKGLVLPFRKALDEIDVDEICWTPYEEHRLKQPFEDVSLFRGWIRWGPKMYAHLLDRVLQQYGHVQTISGSPLEVVGQTTIPDEMDIMFTQYVVHVVDAGAIVQGHVVCSNDYMDWFRRFSHPYIIRREPVHEVDVEPTDHADDDATHAAYGGDPADDTVEITVY